MLRAKGGHAPQKPSRSLLASRATMSGAICRSNPLDLALYSAARVQRVKEQQRALPASCLLLLIGDLGPFSRRSVVIAPKFQSSSTEVFDVHAHSVGFGSSNPNVTTATIWAASAYATSRGNQTLDFHGLSSLRVAALRVTRCGSRRLQAALRACPRRCRLRRGPLHHRLAT